LFETVSQDFRFFRCAFRCKISHCCTSPGNSGRADVFIPAKTNSQAAHEVGDPKSPALAYLEAFLPAVVNQQYSAFLEDVDSAWQPGEKLSEDVLGLLLEMNACLRRAYDASPARSVGMKSFDDEFKPFLGWEDYYSQNL
jgi:hypothetical protein